MRVYVLRSYNGREHAELLAGDTVQMDRGIAERFIEQGIVAHAPLSEDEIAAIAKRAEIGDEKRPPTRHS